MCGLVRCALQHHCSIKLRRLRAGMVRVRLMQPYFHTRSAYPSLGQQRRQRVVRIGPVRMDLQGVPRKQHDREISACPMRHNSADAAASPVNDAP